MGVEARVERGRSEVGRGSGEGGRQSRGLGAWELRGSGARWGGRPEAGAAAAGLVYPGLRSVKVGCNRRAYSALCTF